jgi:hypothetical protein
MQSPHEEGTLLLVSSFSYSDSVRSPTEHAVSQRSSAMDSLRLFPRRLCCRHLDGCCSLSHLYLALFAWQASASGSLSSQICTLPLTLRGLPAAWRSLSQLRHVAFCRASVACARGVCTAVGGRQRACGMKLAGGSGKGLPLMHGSGTRAAPHVSCASQAFASCRGALLHVLRRARQRPQQGGRMASYARPLRSPGERVGRDPYYREWLTERKETSDATARDHDP